MPINHHAMLAYALCWPNDPHPLMYDTAERAEEDRKWFSANYQSDKNGLPRGEPFVLVLCVQPAAQQSIA